jgi:hypothetical protein
VVTVKRLCKQHSLFGILIGLVTLTAVLPAATCFVPKPIPTPISKIKFFQYKTTQNVVDYLGQTQSSVFYENYAIPSIDTVTLNLEMNVNFKFYTSCGSKTEKAWSFESIVDINSRNIDQTLSYQDGMNYEDTHLRIYALSNINEGGIMLSNNLELGYRWGIYTLDDLTMTRGANSLYPIGLSTFEVMTFYGTDAKEPVSTSLPS